MKRSSQWLCLVVIAIISTSCGKETQPMPKDLLVTLLKDIHIAEGLINGHHPVIMKDSLQEIYLAQVLEKWGTTPAEFENALKQMHRDPDYTREVYELVLEKVDEYSEELSDQENVEMEEQLKEEKE